MIKVAIESKKVYKLCLLSLPVFSLILAGCSNSTESNTSESAIKTVKSDFPTRPIEMIVPVAAGSAPDTLARILVNGVSKYLPNNESVVVVNKPGGAGTIGTTELKNAKPDGYTLEVVYDAALTLQPHYGEASYSHDSFQPIIKLVSDPLMLAVRANSPWKTFDEWLEYVKNNPGKFKYGVSGVGGIGHISVEALNKELGLKTKSVSFNGTNEAATALLGGHIDGASITYITLKPYLDSGDMRALLNVGKDKSETIKDIPFYKEVGVDLDGFSNFFGIIAPKGLPEEELNILHDAFKNAMEDPEIKKQLEQASFHLSYEGPEDFQKTITGNFEINGKLLKEIGLIK